MSIYKQIDPVQGLVDFVNDIKPYHTKILEVLVEYVHEEQIRSFVIDNHHLHIHTDIPIGELAGISCDGYDTHPYDSSGKILLISPNPYDSSTPEYIPVINVVDNSIVVLGNKINDFFPGTKIWMTSHIEDYNEYEINEINSNVLIIVGELNYIIPNGQKINIFNNDYNDDGEYTIISSFYDSIDDKTHLTISQPIVDSVTSGYITFENIYLQINSGFYTVESFNYDSGSIDSWPGYPNIDYPNFIIGNTDHTIVKLVESLDTPPTLISNQFYAVEIVLDRLEIIDVLPYSNIIPLTPDEGFSKFEVINTVITITANTGGFIIIGNVLTSNIRVGDSFRISDTLDLNGTYNIAGISYDDLTNTSTIYTTQPVDFLEFEGYMTFDIMSNAFVVSGDRFRRFHAGSKLIVDNSTFSGEYTVLDSDFVNGKTRIRVTDTIAPISMGFNIYDLTTNSFFISGDRTSFFAFKTKLFVNDSTTNNGTWNIDDVLYHVSSDLTEIKVVGIVDILGASGRLYPIELGYIKEKLFAYGEYSDICSNTPDTLINVKIGEKLIFKGMGIDLYDDIIGFNLENVDNIGYEFHINSIVEYSAPLELLPTYSFIGKTSLVKNGIGDEVDYIDMESYIWVEATSGDLYITYNPLVDAVVHKKVTTVYWVDLLHNKVFYRTKTSIVDTGWLPFTKSIPGYSSIVKAMPKTYLDAQEYQIITVDQDYHAQTLIELNEVEIPHEVIGVDYIFKHDLYKVTVNGIPTSIEVLTPTTFNIIHPKPEIGDDLLVKVYNDDGIETNVYVSTFDSVPKLVYHSDVYIEDYNIIGVYGGNFIQNFLNSFDLTITSSSSENRYYLHEQNNYETTWIVNHNLKEKYVHVSVVDEDDFVIMPLAIQYINPQQIVVTFTNNRIGKVILYTSVDDCSTHDTFYLHEQDISSNEWLIEHNLGQKYASITVVDENDFVLIPLEIEYINDNELIVRFTNNHIGKAIINADKEYWSIRKNYYIHEQNISSNQWVIPNNTNQEYPTVTVIDENDEYTFPLSIKYDNGNIIVEFSSNKIGKVLLYGPANILDTDRSLVQWLSIHEKDILANEIKLIGDHTNLLGIGHVFRCFDNALSEWYDYTIIGSVFDGQYTNITIFETLSPNMSLIYGVVYDYQNYSSLLLIDKPISCINNITYKLDPLHTSISNNYSNFIEGEFEEYNVVGENIDPDKLIETSVNESFNFSWLTTYNWNILYKDNNSVFLEGDLITAIQNNDNILIIGSKYNDGNYNVINLSYDSLTNETEVELSPSLINIDDGNNQGYLQINDIDITNWFQYSIIELKDTNIIHIYGDSTNDIQNGQYIKVINTLYNNGFYHVNTTPIFNPNTNITIVSVSESLVNEYGGLIESERDLGARLVFNELIGTNIVENIENIVETDGGQMTIGFEHTSWGFGIFQ